MGWKGSSLNRWGLLWCHRHCCLSPRMPPPLPTHKRTERTSRKVSCEQRAGSSRGGSVCERERARWGRELAVTVVRGARQDPMRREGGTQSHRDLGHDTNGQWQGLQCASSVRAAGEGSVCVWACSLGGARGEGVAWEPTVSNGGVQIAVAVEIAATTPMAKGRGSSGRAAGEQLFV